MNFLKVAVSKSWIGSTTYEIFYISAKSSASLSSQINESERVIISSRQAGGFIPYHTESNCYNFLSY